MKPILSSRSKASAWGMNAVKSCPCFTWAKPGLCCDIAQHFSTRGTSGILQSGMIGQGSVRLAVAHPPITVVQRSGKNAAVGVVPTHNTGSPAQTLGVSEERGVGIECLPRLSRQIDGWVSIQIAPDIVH